VTLSLLLLPSLLLPQALLLPLPIPLPLRWRRTVIITIPKVVQVMTARKRRLVRLFNHHHQRITTATSQLLTRNPMRTLLQLLQTPPFGRLKHS